MIWVKKGRCTLSRTIYTTGRPFEFQLGVGQVPMLTHMSAFITLEEPFALTAIFVSPR